MTEIATKFPTETIDLPSRGWFYPENHPLASGKIELFYMTARHEDILTSQNLIDKGIVIDKLLEALIANPLVKFDDLLIGDKNAIMVASRILGYGKDYEVSIDCPKCDTKNTITVDLQTIDDTEVPFLQENKGKNEFSFTCPISKKLITFKLLTHGDEKTVQQELAGLKKIMSKDGITKEVTTRMAHIILSVDGDTSKEKIRAFINSMPALDSKAFREYTRKINPNIDLSTNFVCSNTRCDYEGRVDVPIDVNFFWPNA